MTPTRTEVLFDRKGDARRVCRRLRDFSLLSQVVGRELWVERPAKYTDDALRDLVKRLHHETPAEARTRRA